MVTCPFTSADRHPRGKPALSALLLLAALLLGGSLFLRAGSIITLTNGSEIDGKLSVAGDGIHVGDDQSSPSDTPLSDVLEATFADSPFTLTSFDAGKINQLPANWTSTNIGEIDSPGSVAVQSGTFTVTGSVATGRHDHEDRLFFASVPWTENGQFTARLVSLDGQSPEEYAGIMFRDSLDPVGSMTGAFLSGAGQIRIPFHQEHRRDNGGSQTTAAAPLWFRFTREGNTVLTSMSSDGTTWDTIAENTFQTISNPLVGLTATCYQNKLTLKAVFDNVSLTPLPSSAQLLPAGVLFQGGSLLAGRIGRIDLDPSAADQNGMMMHGAAQIPFPKSALAAVLTLPIERAVLQANSGKTGLVMQNGDTLDGDITALNADSISVSSVLLGLTTYKPADVRACFIAPLQARPAPFEVRLRDGSILNAMSLTGSGSTVTIADVSGVSIPVSGGEIAQVRAGTAVAQDMAVLDWKAVAAQSGGAAANAAPHVDSVLGKDQQQILEAGLDTAIDFPLPEKFRAIGVEVALSSDSPPNAIATVRFLSDGHELAKSPPIRAGDPPRFMELSLPTVSHITFQADSMFPNVKVLYLDPVAIRN